MLKDMITKHADSAQATMLLITTIFRWLGGSDAELEDDWRWVGSGNAFDYTNWARDHETTTET